MTLQRVVITGSGVVAPLGESPAAFFDSLMRGESGVKLLLTDFSTKDDHRVAAQVQFDPATFFSRAESITLDRSSQMALVAARQAIAESGLGQAQLQTHRCGVAIGTGLGAANTISRTCIAVHRDGESKLRPSTVVTAMPNAIAAHLAMLLGFEGPNLTYSTACSSSTVAIGEAARAIRHGYADCMLAGGAESLLTLDVIKGWEATRALAQADPVDPGRSCKPFSANRDGMVLGEGAGVLVLESLEHARARGAAAWAEVSGYACTNDVAHMTQPTLRGQSAAMRSCLADAGAKANEIGYIHAHGTGTPWNDRVETAAVKAVFGDRAYRIPMSSTKSMHGHLLGASGAVEIIACVEALRQRRIPPTCNLEIPDSECDLDYVAGEGRSTPMLTSLLKNSFAFGGTSASLVLSAPPMY